MPIYQFELEGETHNLYAANIFEAADEIEALWGDSPEQIKEVM